MNGGKMDSENPGGANPGNEKPPLVIDFHVHMLDQHVFDASSGKTVTSGFGATDRSMQRSRGASMIGKMFNPENQIADMDTRGIDMSVITSSTVIQGTSWADPQTDLDLCRRSNDRTAEWVAKYPMRFIGSFVLPLQDRARSMGEFLRSFYYDTCVYDPLVLKTLVERVGIDRLILGSDYPVGESDPVGFARQCGIDGAALASVSGGNTARLLGLAPNIQ